MVNRYIIRHIVVLDHLTKMGSGKIDAKDFKTPEWEGK
jgi:hypothetical protein